MIVMVMVAEGGAVGNAGFSVAESASTYLMAATVVDQLNVNKKGS